MRIPSNKIKDIVRFFRDELNGLYDDAEIQTFITYCFDAFINIKRHEISLKGNETVSESELLKFNFAVKDLKKSRPIQHILGKADFFGMKLMVNEHVLIPRLETEELVQLVIRDIQQLNAKDSLLSTSSILDIGTGSGCIAIALKKNISFANIDAIDISEEALSLAQKNAVLNEVDIHFMHQNILEFESTTITDKKYDIIVSNPPYVRQLEKAEMSDNVLNFEPHIALFVDDYNPLIFYKAIADFALKKLKQSGCMYVEINEYLGQETAEMFVNKAFKRVELLKDINGKNRILRVSY